MFQFVNRLSCELPKNDSLSKMKRNSHFPLLYTVYWLELFPRFVMSVPVSQAEKQAKAKFLREFAISQSSTPSQTIG